MRWRPVEGGRDRVNRRGASLTPFWRAGGSLRGLAPHGVAIDRTVCPSGTLVNIRLKLRLSTRLAVSPLRRLAPRPRAGLAVRRRPCAPVRHGRAALPPVA